MPDANDTNPLAQFESGRGMAPRQIKPETNVEELMDPSKDWPMMLYIQPNGDVITRREQIGADGSEFGSPFLAHRSAVVIKIHPQIEPGNSDGGKEIQVEVLKFRADLKSLMQSATKAFMNNPNAEREILRAIFPSVMNPDALMRDENE